MTRAPQTCGACGGIGHAAGMDGMCSRSALAALAVLSGMSIADASRLHGVKTWNVRATADRQRLAVGRRCELRREVIRSRVEISQAQMRGKVAILNHAAHMLALEEYPEIFVTPISDGLSFDGADHAEIPDPPCLLDVGWRTTR